jgi:hypothetical protein
VGAASCRGPDRAELAPPLRRAGLGVIETGQRTQQVRQPRPLLELARDVREIALRCFLARKRRRGPTVDEAVELGHEPGLPPGLAPDHHSIHALELRAHLRDRREAAVDDDLERRKRALQRGDALVVERGQRAIGLGAHAVQPSLARVHDESAAAGGGDGFDEACEEGEVVVVIDADARLHRHRHVDGCAHRGNALGDERGLSHEADAEASGLYALARTADVEIDLVVAVLCTHPRGGHQHVGIAAAELQRHGMLRRVVAQQARGVAAHDRRGRHHFGVEQRARGEQAQEIAEVPVGALHHGGDRESAIQLARVIRIFRHARTTLD